MAGRAAKRPVRIFEAVEAVGMVSEQTALVAQDDGLVEKESRGVTSEWGVSSLHGDGAIDEVLELSLLVDDRAHEDVVML